LDTISFNPFAKLFPRTYKSPIFFAPSSLSYDALRGTSLLRTTQVLQGQIQQDHERLNSLLKQYNSLHEEPHFPVDEDFPLECYSLFSVYSRGADVNFGGGDGEEVVNRERMIVPFLDMFNHSSESDVHYKSDSSDIYIYSGASPIKAGAEVHLNYGPVPNSKLLLFYGFSIQENKEDFVDIYVPLQEGVPGREEKAKLLQETFPDFIPNAPFQLKSDGSLPCSLLSLLRVLPLPPSSLPSDVMVPISAESEASALSALEAALESMSQNVAISLLEVAGRIEDGEGVEEEKEDYEFARIYAESELQILSTTLGVVREAKDKENGGKQEEVQVEVQVEVVKEGAMESVD
jgi:hypothetical protein